MSREKSNHRLPKLVVILGPTASGKTALAIRLARRFRGEIVSADSRQIYKKMSIGTSKPSAQERSVARHHLIDLTMPDKTFTLYDWQQRAFTTIGSVIMRHKIPFLVGGTGLYISSIIENYKIPRKKSKPRYDVLIIGIDVPRARLYDRINARVLKMIRAGLEKEACALSKKYSWQLPSMHGIGYREWRPHFEGSATKEEVIKKIQQASRNYAKRQMTWFRGMERNNIVHWVRTESQAARLVKQFVSQGLK